ncbi:pyridoxamine 5'-phosphate oxidase family protein [Aurantimonas aggregata]|uniref:Pyridoxamine 5'-phosphate oxidase family protein n=1 Tax=Aurantimonas aggregata TaxID=2047720 RepID=A0A6L9MEV6_9HYPH|nr:pyridoxamine 5'-phosphate oxidase family protein [Aurantimonas aggregata]NDV86349.1 pyridoxamine 5'-phosphate oxidase family protein [Aurantimonas aggregata]
MSDMTLSDLAEAMRDIDFAMLSTKTGAGDIAARPMSNNRDVDYDGDSFFFTYEEARTVSDIERDPKVGLSFQGKAGLLGKPPLFISVEGTAELIRDKAQFEAHWNSDLDYWFEDGIDTPGVVLIRVHADRIHYWNGKDEGDVTP